MNAKKYSHRSYRFSLFLRWALAGAGCILFGIWTSPALAQEIIKREPISEDFINWPATPKESQSVSDAKSDASDLSDMAFIRGGKFVRGSNFGDNKNAFKMCRQYDKSCRLWWFSDEYPLKLVKLDSYWIDIYEVTNEKYLEFVKATGHPPALDASCTTDGCREGNLWEGESFPSVIRKQPVTQVSWYDAEAYCKWRGKRLPTEAEWEKAARGPSGSMYPWGSGSPIGRATYHRKWKGLYTMTNVGTYPGGVSVYGVHDMAGNVWEWVSDWYSRTYYTFGTKKNPQGWEEGEYKSLRGGSWVNNADTLRSAFRRWSRPDVRFNDTGFRCAKSASDVPEAE